MDKLGGCARRNDGNLPRILVLANLSFSILASLPFVLPEFCAQLTDNSHDNYRARPVMNFEALWSRQKGPTQLGSIAGNTTSATSDIQLLLHPLHLSREFRTLSFLVSVQQQITSRDSQVVT